MEITSEALKEAYAEIEALRIERHTLKFVFSDELFLGTQDPGMLKAFGKQPV